MWTCSKCREEVEDNFDVCWNCGTGKDGSEDPSFQRADEMPVPEVSAQAEVEAEALTAQAEPAAQAEVVAEAVATHPELQRKAPPARRMIVTTTSSVEGKRIKRYCGIVTGEAVLGANVFKDLLAGLTDFFGGRSGAYEREFRSAREIALAEMEKSALELGANAVVGVDLDYESLGQTNTILMVCVSGTAVVVG